MAKFNAEEVSDLQAGGNERARQIYFKAWDPQCNSFPDASNLHRLRDFIKHVYVDRKYTGEISHKTSMVRVGEKDDFYERRSFERYSQGSRDDFSERCSYERPSSSGMNEYVRYSAAERRSPRYKQENGRAGGHRSRTAHFEVVDDRFRDDGYGNGGRSAILRFSDAESRARSRSPDPQISGQMTNTPVLRPFKDILDANAHVGKHPTTNDGRDADGSSHEQTIMTCNSASNQAQLHGTAEGSRDDFSERHSYERPSSSGMNEYSQGSRDDFSERCSYERPSSSGMNEYVRYSAAERRSPRYKQENGRAGGHRSRTAHFEVVDDRFRDDGYGNGGRSAILRFSDAESRARSRSPDPQISGQMTNTPVLRPFKDILDANAHVGKHPTTNDGRDADGSSHEQKPAPSTSLGSVDRRSGENKSVNSSSLIDFMADSEPPAAAASQTPQMVRSVDVGNSSIGSSAMEKASKAPNMNSLEYLLFELSAPAPAPAGIMPEASTSSETPSSTSVASSNCVNDTITGSTINTPVVPSNEGVPTASRVGNEQVVPSSSEAPVVKKTDEQQLPTMQQHQPSAVPGGDSGHTAQQSTPSVEDALFNEPWPSSPPPNAQGTPPFASSEHPSQAVSKAVQESITGDVSKYNGRKELPADLFTYSSSSFPATVSSWQFRPPPGLGYSMQYFPTAMPIQASPNPTKSTNPFDLSDDSTLVQNPMSSSAHKDLFTYSSSSFPAAVSSWQFRPPPGLGYSMQYFPTAMPIQASPNPTKSTNPFDLSDDSTLVQNPMFPPMTSLQGALANVSASTGLLPHSSPYASALALQSPSCGMTMPPEAYTGQPLAINMPISRPQGIGSFRSEEAAFASLNPIHPSSGRYPGLNAPNPSPSAGGNPFG
ncbi:unnamed protein product [Ilex paraguariensis]|uniref:ADP-ribosylation factor GTPase-activating protein AGD14 n=1 Tax=Ilex paraguariensis TaxID=185542 RepID=A0ABC8V052_9AQUA